MQPLVALNSTHTEKKNIQVRIHWRVLQEGRREGGVGLGGEN